MNIVSPTLQTDLYELLSLLKAGISPYHTVRYCAELLKSHDFKELKLGGRWNIQPGNGYFVNVYDTTLTGFWVGEDVPTGSAPTKTASAPAETASAPAETGFTSNLPALRIAASHTDWPCLMVKPSPELTYGPYAKLNISIYGGPILNTWLDRPLSIAGKVCLRGSDAFHPDVHFVNFKRPLLTIPNLAIHFNREVNRGIELNPQIDMQPLLGVLDETLNHSGFFLDLMAEELKCKRDDILDYECYIYNCDEPQVLGLRGEMLSSPRLDNLTSVHACISGLLHSNLPNGICVSVLYDNEEIGSSTKQGAASPLLERILEKIYLSLGYGRSDFLDALFNGFLLSLDVAHAVHPNKGEKYDPVDRICLNQGVTLKMAVSQAYATDASHISIIEDLCRRNRIPYRKFSNRADMRGGSTLGSISSCLLNMPAVDVGAPILAMHSSRELMGICDQWALSELTRKFMQ